MIRLAYIVSHLGQTGPNYQLRYIVQNLSGEFTVLILSISGKKNDNVISDIESDQLRVVYLNMNKLKEYFSLVISVRKILASYSPDVIHTQGIRSDLISAFHLKSYNRISTIRCNPFIDYVDYYGKIIGWLSACLHILALKKINTVVACSESISNDLKKYVETIFIRNGVDCSKFNSTNSDSRVDIRRKLNIPKDAIIFSSAGGLIPRKNPSALIEPFSLIRSNKTIVLLLIGDGVLRTRIEELSTTHRVNCIITGVVTNVVDYLKASDYYVSNSNSEGLPNGVLEAMSMGLPVLLSDIKSHREVLSLDRNSGILFNRLSIKSIAMSIESMLKGDYQLMSSSALAVATGILNDKVMSKSYQKIYLRNGLME